MQVCLAQLNPTVGDLEGNTQKLGRVLRDYAQADLIVFPELFLTGYPPRDLLWQEDFLDKTERKLVQILEYSKNFPQPAVVLGLPRRTGKQIFNSVAVFQNGKLLALQHKRTLTRFRLYDEHRYFSPGPLPQPIMLQKGILGIALGLELDSQLAQTWQEAGVSLIVNPGAFPFRFQQAENYLQEFQRVVGLVQISGVQLNQVGANDELIFGGGSGAVNKEGELLASLPRFETETRLVDVERGEKEEPDLQDQTAQVYRALVLGLRDYVHKNGMSKVILGLSGGLDSALAAVIAKEALGSAKVWALALPGPYSSPESVEDAGSLAANLGIKFDVLPISPLYDSFLDVLAEQFAGQEINVAEENIQARLRGDLLMALSNKFGGLVLTNSNKSELAVGYCTLYGDMSGGLALIGDVYKTMVYELAYYINRFQEIIPWRTIEKPPSAELRPNQRDDDSLPPYEVLDPILKLILDKGFSKKEVIMKGFCKETVNWVFRTVDSSDYKRRQAATVLSVTSPVFGYPRQMPLAKKR